MSDEWDFYFLRVDDKPASIFVDLGLEADAPIAGLGQMAWIRLYFHNAREDGLSSEDEYPVLIAIEDALQQVLVRDDTRYVGRNTTDGFRDFVFYTVDVSDWSRRAADALAMFHSYEYDTGAREDFEWSVYFNFLLPSARDRQRISNRSVCDALREKGDALSAQREIDHWAYFPSAAERDAFVISASQAGYSLRTLIEPDENQDQHGAHLFKIESPDQPDIDLMEMASSHNGDYDGWETQILQSPQRH